MKTLRCLRRWPEAVRSLERLKAFTDIDSSHLRLPRFRPGQENHVAGSGDRLRNNPLLKPLNLPPLGGSGSIVGPLLTKTLLIYALSRGGTGDGPCLTAYDKATGRELTSTDLRGIALGTPMTYRLGDKQYIAVTVAGKTGELPELVALALP